MTDCRGSAEIKSVLADILRCAKTDDLDSLLMSISKVAILIKETPLADPVELKEIGELHRLIRLAIADRKDVVSSRISTIRHGKRIARAYGDVADPLPPRS